MNDKFKNDIINHQSLVARCDKKWGVARRKRRLENIELIGKLENIERKATEKAYANILPIIHGEKK